MLGLPDDARIYRGRGCEACTYTGFWGRLGLFEFLVVDDVVRRLILKNADEGQIRQAARQGGMKTLLEDGLTKIELGSTTLPEVFRVTRED